MICSSGICIYVLWLLMLQFIKWPIFIFSILEFRESPCESSIIYCFLKEVLLQYLSTVLKYLCRYYSA